MDSQRSCSETGLSGKSGVTGPGGRGPQLAGCLVAALLLALCPPVRAALDCDLDGQPVNLDNGATTAGRSGLVRCVDRDSRQVQREETYVNGRPLGLRRTYDAQGGVTSGAVNARGNRDGPWRRQAADGRLISEETLQDGTRVGLSRSFSADGRLERIEFDEPPRGPIAGIRYNRHGQISELRCAPRPVLPVDRAPCGFDGPSTVALYNDRGEVTAQLRFVDGRRIGFVTFSASGVPASSEEVEEQRTVRRSFYPDGQLRGETVLVENRRRFVREFAAGGQKLREIEWDESGRNTDSQWYMNGSIKRREIDALHEQAPARAIEEYWDNGQLRSRGMLDRRGTPIGMHQFFREAGTVASERYYQRGLLSQRRDFNDAGDIVLEESYYEDGSRKSSMRR